VCGEYCSPQYAVDVSDGSKARFEEGPVLARSGRSFLSESANLTSWLKVTLGKGTMDGASVRRDPSGRLQGRVDLGDVGVCLSSGLTGSSCLTASRHESSIASRLRRQRHPARPTSRPFAWFAQLRADSLRRAGVAKPSRLYRNVWRAKEPRISLMRSLLQASRTMRLRRNIVSK
jgi:hypothetical protein